MDDVKKQIEKYLTELSAKHELIIQCRIKHDELVDDYNSLIERIEELREEENADKIYKNGCNHRDDNLYGKPGQVEHLGNSMKICSLCDEFVMSIKDNRWYTPPEWKRACVIRHKDRLIRECTVDMFDADL